MNGILKAKIAKSAKRRSNSTGRRSRIEWAIGNIVDLHILLSLAWQTCLEGVAMSPSTGLTHEAAGRSVPRETGVRCVRPLGVLPILASLPLMWVLSAPQGLHAQSGDAWVGKWVVAKTGRIEFISEGDARHPPFTPLPSGIRAIVTTPRYSWPEMPPVA